MSPSVWRLVGMLLVVAILAPCPSAARQAFTNAPPNTGEAASVPTPDTSHLEGPGAAPLGVEGRAVENTGQVDVAGEAESTERPPETFFEIVHSAGVIGYVIILSSIVAVALVIEHAISIRRATLCPDGLADRVALQVKQGQLTQAEQACRGQPSLLGTVLLAGMAQRDLGWPAVEKAMEDVLAQQAARLFRKIEYLSVIGNIAPMLGLLGTVLGMVFAFREVAASQGTAQAADLAGGIYLALVTTVQGLVVAIPALGAHALFRNRVDQLVADAAQQAESAMAPLRRGGIDAPVQGFR